MNNLQDDRRELPAPGQSRDFDIDAVADGLDHQSRTRAAARIVSHFSELRGEVETFASKLAAQAKQLSDLESRIASMESSRESDRNDDSSSGANTSPRRLPFSRR